MDDWMSILLILVMGAAAIVLSGLALLVIITFVSGIFGWFSTKSKAARARENKGLSEALRIYAAEGKTEDVAKCLKKNLPNWPVRAGLIDAASELLQLRSGAAVAAKSGVPTTLTNALAGEAQTAIDSLWVVADHLESVKSQGMVYEQVQADLQPEIEHLAQLATATRQARHALAGWTLSETGDLERAELNLRSLAQSVEIMGSAAAHP